MLRIALLAPFHAAFLGVFVLVAPATGQVPARPATVSEAPLPGGLRAALAAIGDSTAPDRAQFLAEFIRRIYDTPIGAKGDTRESALRSLLAQLKAGGQSTDTVPLPLSSSIWIDVVFRKQAKPDTLVASILESRNAALLYNGLLSLDDDSRAWMAQQPALIEEIASRRAAPFLIAAPGLRITAAGVQVPGGQAAEPVWQALVGHRPTEANDFVRALLSSDEGRLAFFFGAMAQLNPQEIQFAMALDLADARRRVDAGRRLYGVFERLWLGRALEQRVFVRPAFDPALLVSELGANGDDGPAVPGTRGFWSAVFAEERESPGKKPWKEPSGPITWDQPPDFPWLCEQVFKGDQPEYRRHFMMVLFASRHAAGVTKEAARDALEAIRAAGTYPALTATIERAGVSDLAVVAAAARRAAALTAIEDETRASRALAQYQGALAMITRAASRGTLTAESATKLVSSLAAIGVSDRGDYEGRIVAWLGAWLNANARPAQRTAAAGPAGDGSVDELYESASGPMEEDALRILSGKPAAAPRLLDWEGTRYRLDLPRAEAVRLTQSHGQSSRPYLSSAGAVMSVADALSDAGLTREAVQQQAQAFGRIWQTDPTAEATEDSPVEPLKGYGEASKALQRAARSGDVHAASRLAPALRVVADEFVARGLMEWAYAAALGPRDGISISAAEAASRHDFGTQQGAGLHAWQLPVAGNDVSGRWHVLGPLLGLDVALANFSLVSLSFKPPSIRPTLGEIDRRVFIDAVALVEPKSLSDSDRDAIAAAIRNGRARLAALRSSSDAIAIADAIPLSAQRRTLLSWTVEHDPTRIPSFLSPSELFWLGAADVRVDTLDAWGVPAGSRTGCLCVQVVRHRSWETFAGRWNTGMVASAFPDLNFRLAELLSDLHMPAALLAPVLTSATLDFVNSVTSRDQDDRRGLVEFVQALQVDRLEQYLALLTSDGPLVPVGDAPVVKDTRRLGATAHLWRLPQ